VKNLRGNRSRSFSARNIEQKTATKEWREFSKQKIVRHLHRSEERFTKCASGGHKKSEPARSAQPRPYKTLYDYRCAALAAFVFFSYERRLSCRFSSAARQRNQSRVKQTITTPIQDESIRQDGTDVNS
jgi:hypothetical protein